MAKNLVMAGAVLPLTIAAGCASGDPVIVGEIKGVALGDVAAGEVGQISTQGVYELPKTSVAVSEGEKAYLTPGGSVTTSASGNTEYGGFVAEAVAGDDTGLVKLPG